MLSKTLLQIVKYYGIHYVLTTILKLFGTYFTRQQLYKMKKTYLHVMKTFRLLRQKSQIGGRAEAILKMCRLRVSFNLNTDAILATSWVEFNGCKEATPFSLMYWKIFHIFSSSSSCTRI